MSYDIIFWGNSSKNNSVLKIQKEQLVTVNSSSRTSCRELFNKELQILTLRSQYIYSLLMFVIKTDSFLNQIQMFIILGHATILICTCLQLI